MNIPHNIEAEESILCACLNDPQAAAMAMSALNADSFYSKQNAVVFRAIMLLSSQCRPTDIVSVASELTRTRTINDAGGVSRLSGISDGIGSSRTVKAHCHLVREAYKARVAIDEARYLIERLSNGESFKDVAGHHLSALSRLASTGRAKPQTMAEITPAVMEQLREICENGKPLGISTGFSDIDRRLSGMARKDLLIVAARPSMGKTVFGMQIAMAVAKQGLKVMFFSMEMGNEQLVTRSLSSRSGVSGDVLRKGYLNDSTWPKVEAAERELAALPMVLVDAPALSISELQAIARAEHAKGELGLIVADYLQLSRADVGKSGNREREISIISSGLKGMAKELNIPVVALSQLNRSLENRTDKRPQLSDLRESGAIEQDADVVMFIYRDEVYNKGDDNPNKGIAEIITAKQRNGPTGTDKLLFQGEFSRFVDFYRGEI